MTPLAEPTPVDAEAIERAVSEIENPVECVLLTGLGLMIVPEVMMLNLQFWGNEPLAATWSVVRPDGFKAYVYRCDPAVFKEFFDADK